MRQTIKEIEVNAADRWYIGYGLSEKIPHFSRFSKNYTRRFEGTDLFEQIFSRVIAEIIKHGFINEGNVFIDDSHIKANANNHKYQKTVVEKSAKFTVFSLLYDKLKAKYESIKNVMVDAGYKIPAIAKMIIDGGKTPIIPYKRLMTKKGFLRNMIIFMMNISIAISAQTMRSCIQLPIQS